MSRRAVLLLLGLAALPLHAGDPVPDVDVTVEQVPGKIISVEAPGGGAFDEVRIEVPRKVGRGIAPDRLPEGWTLSRDGTALVLRGPEVAPPVRLRLTLGDDRPRELTYEVRRAGAVLLRRENVILRLVLPRQVRNSLQGVVQLPAEVAPGETVAFRALDTAQLPPGGRFVLSGVVTEPIPEQEWADISFAIVNTTRSHLKTRMAAALPPAGFELQAPQSSCAELAPLAAALAAAGELDQGGAYMAVPTQKSGGSPPGKPDPQKMMHDTAKSSIRNMKAFYAAAPVSPEGDGGRISIKEKGIEISIKEQGVQRDVMDAGGEEGQVWTVTAPGATAPLSIAWRPAAGDLSFDDPRVVPVALRGEPTAGGCRFTPREPGWLEVARTIHNTRSNIKGRSEPAALPDDARPGNTLSGTVYAIDLPPDLAPGTSLALQYLDRYGDLWLDVPAVPGTEIVPPPPAGEEPPPCFEAATRYVQSEELICVCGRFPSPAAWSALLFDERPAGTPVSASSRTVWLRPPAGTAPGTHVISGHAEAGFAPGCRAETQLVEIRGAIDSQSLLRGDSTPMRLSVGGTTDPVSLRVRNLTPGIIAIDGGVEQTAETSGGPENVLTRQVRGLTRGNFNVEWTLAAPPCPCGAPPPAR